METGRWTPALLLSLTFLLGLSLGYITRDTVFSDDPRRDPRPGRDARPEFGAGMSGTPGPGGLRSPQLVDRMADTLELTEVQREELDRILEDNRLKMMALRRGVQPRQRAISDSARKAVEALLTQEQMRRLNELRGDMRMRPPRGGQRGGGPRRQPF